MKYMKRILILTLVMLTLVSMASVCAADVNDTAIASEDTTIIESSECNNLTDRNIVINPDNPQTNPNNNPENNERIGEFGTFTELQDMIDNAGRESTITLEKDYMYDEGFDINGISIGKPLTIDGNNHIINANSKSRIFSCSNDIILKNIIFVGGSTSDSGGAIYITNGQLTIESCKFINNSARYGGAIYCAVNGDLSISQSEFVNNKASMGGAIYQISSNHNHYIETINGEDYERWDNSHSNLEITDNTKFINNSAALGGAAICMNKKLNSIFISDENGELYLDKNITFEDNTGSSIISLSGPDFRIYEANFINNHISDSVIWVGDLVVNASIIKYPPGDCDFHDYNLDKVVFKDNSGKDIDGAISINGDVIMVKFDSSYNGKGLVNLYSSHNSKNFRYDEWGLAVEGLESDFVNGVALFNINDIVNVLPGEYILDICYANNHEASARVPITLVKKVSTKLTANDVTTTYNVNKDLVVTLKDANGVAINGAKISIDLNGVKTLTTDSNGQVKIATGSLAPNVYNAKIIFAGDDNYLESAITVKVTVEKSSQKSDSGKSTTVKKQATKIIANNKNFKAKTKVKKYTVTLKTKAGKVINKVKLILKVKGKTITAKTNNKGKAIFKIKNLKKKGTFKATVTFKGNKNYKKVSKTVKIKIK